MGKKKADTQKTNEAANPPKQQQAKEEIKT